MVERIYTAAERRATRLKNWVIGRSRELRGRSADRILSDPRPSRCLDSDDLFWGLQNQYPPRPEYGYDRYSTWRRASQRVLTMLRKVVELRQPGLRILEVGAGDGMTGRVLADYGHHMVLCDVQDWRDSRADALPFVKCDVCEEVPMGEGAFDLIYSYNTFEHLENPASAFDNLQRLCAQGGHVILSFGPLYCSPWGLHAYRAIRFPYPQFLFCESFILEKVATLGIYDLARDTDSLQPVNGWRVAQYKSLWSNKSFDIRAEYVAENWSHLDLVHRFPKAFRGRGLTTVDLTTQALYVLLRKVE